MEILFFEKLLNEDSIKEIFIEEVKFMIRSRFYL